MFGSYSPVFSAACDPQRSSLHARFFGGTKIWPPGRSRVIIPLSRWHVYQLISYIYIHIHIQSPLHRITELSAMGKKTGIRPFAREWILLKIITNPVIAHMMALLVMVQSVAVLVQRHCLHLYTNSVKIERWILYIYGHVHDQWVQKCDIEDNISN